MPPVWDRREPLHQRERVVKRREGLAPLRLHGGQVGGRLGVREDEIQGEERADGVRLNAT